MECLYSEHPLSATENKLLTHTDKIRAVQSSLGIHRHATDLFLPNDEFYKKIEGPDDIELMAKTIFGWMRIKHKSLVFHLNPTQDEPLIFTKSHGHSQASLGWKALEDPFYAGAIIAHAIVHHLLAGRHKLIMNDGYENEVITDLGTIYAGLGILVLNGLESRYNPLGAVAKENYISEFLDFVNDQRIVSTVWQPFVIPSVVGSFIELESIPKPAKFISRLVAKRKSTKIKYIISGSLIVAVVLFVTLYTVTQPKYSYLDSKEDSYTIYVLREQISHCEKTVEYKKSRWDKSDIFIQRQIEADTTRCQSLKNRYNYELNEYRAKTQP